MRDLSSLTRDRTCAPAVEAQSSNHWTAREVPCVLFIYLYIFNDYLFRLCRVSVAAQGIFVVACMRDPVP